ncbi:MarR family winged helix-turn-helix transcriptional regulator [Nesterenkonia muleiensis]|uniref:MarR family winged helix-turn-helix transcriptional regulator n=1 Tax=Nesterenkonia muleiensis TaxID=2282648 RepID=UPI00192E44BD|nr:MarR family transcriptional regulator [Nesterenkonia muleiensis]
MEEIEGASALQPARLRQTPSWLITQTATLTNRLISAALTEAGATRYHYAVLAALEEFGPTSQAELGRRCHIDRSDIVATINNLVHERYVERRQDPADRRQNLITLTEAGQQRLQHIAGVLDGVQHDLLGHLAEREREALTTTLRTILDHPSNPENGEASA